MNFYSVVHIGYIINVYSVINFKLVSVKMAILTDITRFLCISNNLVLFDHYELNFTPLYNIFLFG